MPHLTGFHLITYLCVCSVHLQFPTLGTSLWLPWRPLQQEVPHDSWFDYVDLHILLLLFRHRIGRRGTNCGCVAPSLQPVY